MSTQQSARTNREPQEPYRTASRQGCPADIPELPTAQRSTTRRGFIAAGATATAGIALGIGAALYGARDDRSGSPSGAPGNPSTPDAPYALRPGGTSVQTAGMQFALYGTVAEMAADPALSQGTVVRTLGYHRPGDAGAASYTVEPQTAGSDPKPASAGLVALAAKDLAARLVVPGSGATPEMFGACGDGVADDTDALQAAVDTGVMRGTPGACYRLSRTLDVSGKKVDFNGSSVAFGDRNRWCMRAEGTLKATLALAADANAFEPLTLDDVSPVAVGDIVVVEANQTDGTGLYAHPFSTVKSYYCTGGTFLVTKVSPSSNTIGVSPAVEFPQYAGSTVLVYTPSTCAISNLAGIVTTNEDEFNDGGILIKACHNASVASCRIDSRMYSGISIAHSIGTRVADSSIRVRDDRFPKAGNVYGIVVGPTSQTTISGCDTCSDWHGITTGGVVGMGRVTPSQYLLVQNCRLSLFEEGLTGLAYCCHANEYKTTLRDCCLEGLGVGVGATVQNCTITSKKDSQTSLRITGATIPQHARTTTVSGCTFGRASVIGASNAATGSEDGTEADAEAGANRDDAGKSTYFDRLLFKDCSFADVTSDGGRAHLNALDIDGFTTLKTRPYKQGQMQTDVLRIGGCSLHHPLELGTIAGADVVELHDMYVDAAGLTGTSLGTTDRNTLTNRSFAALYPNIKSILSNLTLTNGSLRYTVTLGPGDHRIEHLDGSATIASAGPSANAAVRVHVSDSTWLCDPSIKGDGVFLDTSCACPASEGLADCEIVTIGGVKYVQATTPEGFYRTPWL